MVHKVIGSDVSPAAFLANWQPEWGKPPGEGAIGRMQKFVAEKRARGALYSRETAELFLRDHGDFATLYVVDPEAVRTVLEHSMGLHIQIRTATQGLEDSFVYHLIKSFCLKEGPFHAKDADILVVLNKVVLEIFQFDPEKVHRFMQSTGEYARVCNQLLFEPAATGLSKLGLTMVSRHLSGLLVELAMRDGIDIWDGLAKESKRFLEREHPRIFTELRAFHEKAISAAGDRPGTSTGGAANWLPDWGPRPSEEEIAEACLLSDREIWDADAYGLLAAGFLRRHGAGPGLDALYVVRPHALRGVLAQTEGLHQDLCNEAARLSRAGKRAFLLHLARTACLMDESLAEARLMKVLMLSLSLFHLSRGGFENGIVEFCRETGEYARVCNQFLYESAFGLDPRMYKGYLLEGARQAVGEAVRSRVDIWDALSEDVRRTIKLELPNEFEALDRLHKGLPEELPLGPNDVHSAVLDGFLAVAADAPREWFPETGAENRRLAYSHQVVTSFLELFGELGRPTALAAIAERDMDLARLLLRSAKGHHLEIGAALHALPEEVAVRLLEAQLLEFPQFDNGDRAAVSRFYELDGIGALKFLLVVDGARFTVSPLFHRLSEEAQAKVVEAFRVFEIVERTSASAVRAALEDAGAFGAHPSTSRGPSVEFAGAQYDPKATRSFLETADPGAFLALWREDPERAGVILRGAKFHDRARQLMEPLADAHLTHVLDASLSGFSEFDDLAAAARFMQLDGGNIVRGLALLPRERIVQVLNAIQDETLARVLNQVFYVANHERRYLEDLYRRALASPEMDREKVVRALSFTRDDTAQWVRRVLFGGELDIEVTRAEVERGLREAGDADYLAIINQRINSAADIHHVEYLIGRTTFFAVKVVRFGEDEEQFRRILELARTLGEDFEVPVDALAIRRFGDLAEAVANIRYVAHRRGNGDLMKSRDLFLLELIIRKVAPFLAGQIFSGTVQKPIRSIRDGCVTARVIVLRETDVQLGSPALYQLEPSHLVVLPGTYPANDRRMSKVAGIVTSINTGEHDHAALRAGAWGIPLGTLPFAHQLLKPFDGKWVTYESGSIRLATPDEITEAKRRFGILEVEEVIRDERDILDPGEITRESDRQRVGVKPYNLALLIRAGLPVPATKFITVGAVHRFYRQAGLFDEISRILGPGYATEREDVLGPKLDRIKELIIAKGLPTEVADHILEVNRLLPGIARIARHGNVLEDRPDFMAAGYYGSFVSTAEEQAVLLAVKQAWASYWNMLPTLARIRFGLDHFNYLPGVALMDYVLAQAAGNMIVQAGQTVINAVPGQGAGFAERLVPPDVFAMREGSLDIELHRAEGRTRKVVIAEGRLLEVDLSVDEAARVAIDEVDARGLHDLGRRVYTLAGSALDRDVEWVKGEGGLFIVQDRPYVER